MGGVGGGGGGGVVGGGVAGLTEIKANSASQQSWSWGLAELGDIFEGQLFFYSCLCFVFIVFVG